MSSSAKSPLRAFGVVGALLAGALIGVPGTSSAVEDASIPAAQVGAVRPVQWGPCSETSLRGVPADQVNQYSCSTYRMPIDHDNAALGTIDIALLKRAAKTPGAKIGSLFLNPGGPGESGLRLPTLATIILQQRVLDRFDLIGFDPRGIGESNPLRCFATQEDADDILGSLVGVPLSRGEISGALAAYRDYGQFCKNNAGALLNHMSTKDVVRDLDVLRAAVGEEKLNFVGFSYGTLIGSTYANMFPRQTRAIVLDGNVDPALRTADGLQYDRQRAQGSEISLDDFLAKCQQVGAKCAFSSGQPRDKFDELRTYLRQQPIALPDGGRFDISGFTNGVAAALHSPALFAGLATDLQDLYGLTHPTGAPVQSKAAIELKTLRTAGNSRMDMNHDSLYAGDDSFFAVNCSDKRFTRQQQDVASMAATWERESPTFGRNQAFSEAAACPVWPAEKPDVYRGPWRVKTDNPILVVGNFHDPATRYTFAQRMADELGYSRLLSVDAFGHTILGRAAGVDAAATDYLIDLKVPAAGQVFQPNVQPFDSPA